MDRRRATRFELSLPVELKDGKGTTRDISSSGVLFETDRAFSRGDAIELRVVFDDSTVQCQGTVVRVEKMDDAFGVAVEFASYGFQ